ncbi:Rieske (2Fe-2S) protein [Peterkaempfera bronchialis]|uniref:Rieske (2Fe-2S) protein n=1 Tax=Peterkaempfera bronchialis TaxID=2126346 RepID=UPI003C2AF67C
MTLTHPITEATAATATAEGSGQRPACACASPAAEAGVPRRTAMLASIGLAAALAAGCAAGGSSVSSAVEPGEAQDGTQGGPQGGADQGSAPATEGAGGAEAGQALVKVSEVPVGGGVVVDKKYVVTQPEQGRFKAFSAICTHAGCPVNAVSGGTINCPCHGSRFAIADGSVAGGPAPSGLAPQNITVSGDTVRLA